MGFTNNDILTLARAGFTSTQIAAMNSVQAAPIQQTPINNQNDQLYKMLETMQMENIIKATQPAVQTTDDILASIIAPPTNTGGAQK